MNIILIPYNVCLFIFPVMSHLMFDLTFFVKFFLLSSKLFILNYLCYVYNEKMNTYNPNTCCPGVLCIINR